jgi:hypothetical protein
MRDCLFIWVPKCAGTSVFSTLKGHGCRKLKSAPEFTKFDNRGPVTFGHVGIPALVQSGIVGQKYLDGAFKFAFVRNPWDRMVSLWAYLSHAGIPRRGIPFDEFVAEVAVGVPPVGPYNRKGLSQANPMSDWLFDGDKPLTDFVGRVERPADFRVLGDILGLDSAFPVSNVSNHGEYRNYYTEETRRLVGKLYEQDVGRFEYEF